MCTTNLPRRPPCAASAGPLFCSNTATVASQTCFFCCARIPILRRVRWRAQPSATKERYGCGPPLAGAHRPFFPVFTGGTVDAATPHRCLRRPTFSVAPEKVGKKMRLETIYGAYAQILFSALFGRKNILLPIAFSSDKCTTLRNRQPAAISILLISGILGQLRFCTAC